MTTATERPRQAGPVRTAASETGTLTGTLTAARQSVVTRSPGPVAEPVPLSRRIVAGVLLWLLVLLCGVGLAAAALGAVAERRAQGGLLSDLRREVGFAQAAASAPLGGTAVARAPLPGNAVALLQVPSLGLQRVVVEGARPGDTQAGPGHVPGTAGLGQPGNAVVVGRLTGYGAAFGRLGAVRPGAKITVTTVQGQSVYTVTSVGRTDADVLAPSKDDRLTLLTAAGRGAGDWTTPRAVTAVLSGRPYAPTPQGSRAAGSDGATGDASALPLAVIWGTLLLAAAVATVLLYRRWLLRSTYLLTTPALVALTVLFTDAVTRLLPAWV